MFSLTRFCCAEMPCACRGEKVAKMPPGGGVTWKPEYVTDGIDLSLRPVRVVDLEPGLVLVIR